MKKKTPLLLIGLIILPLLVMLWLIVRLETQQQTIIQHELDRLVETQLSQFDQQFQGLFFQIEQGLTEASKDLFSRSSLKLQPEKFRELEKTSPYIDHIFALDESQTLAFPVGILSQKETRFISEFEPLISRGDLFDLPNIDADNVNDVQQVPNQIVAKVNESSQLFSAPLSREKASKKIEISRSYSVKSESAPPKVALSDSSINPVADAEFENRRRSENTQADSLELQSSGIAASQIVSPQIASSEITSGWIAWYQGSQVSFVLWQRDLKGRVIGYHLNSASLLSEIINLLPTELEDETPTAIRLRDHHESVLYEWGFLNPIPENLTPLETLSLSYPLSSWSLAYYSPNLRQVESHWFEKVLVLLLVAIVLSVLAWLLYREQTRASRLASQRVNFVNQVSHELKTPLTNVRMYTELLEQNIEGDLERTQRYLKVIDNESLRLTRLIENVLSFSRLENKVPTITPVTSDIGRLVEQISDSFAPSFEQKGLCLEIVNKQVDQVFIDPNVLEQLLNNLLSNCEKYAQNSGAVELTLWRDHGYLNVRVKDNGPGIDNSFKDKVFQPFYRCSNKLTEGVSGTGIGLSISRELAQLHGGDLNLEASETGASFKFSLKLLESES